MTRRIAPSAVLLPGATIDDSDAVTPTYRTKTSFVAVHFDQAGKGRIEFIPYGATLRVVGPSACLRGGFEVLVDNKLYNIFEIDLLARSVLVLKSASAKRPAMAACA